MQVFGQSGQEVRAMWDSHEAEWEEEEDEDNRCDGEYDRGEGLGDLFQDKDENGLPSWFGDLFDDEDENGLPSPIEPHDSRPSARSRRPPRSRKPAGSKKK